MDRHFDEATTATNNNNNKEAETINQKCNSQLVQTMESENSSSSFDCNICFDSAHDPVVTLCGHLYCWVCIFKWLHVKNSFNTVQNQACPVCKADISQATLIPLFCHGPSKTETDGMPSYCDFVPPRPTVCGLQTIFSTNNRHSNQQFTSVPLRSQSSSFPRQQYLTSYGSYATISSPNLVSTTIASIINPTIGLLGELVYSRMFGNTDSSLFTYPLRSSYASRGHNSSRIRRQESRIDKSLNRVSVFILCCILCLLLF